MQVRKPAEVVDVDMHESTSVADLVVEVEEEHRDQNLLSLDLASEQGKSGFRDPSEEQYSPTLTEQGTVPAEAEAQADAKDVPVSEGAEMLHREGGTDALSHLQALQEGKAIAPESGKTAIADAPDPYCFAGVVEGSAIVEERAPVSIVELPAASPRNPSPRKQRRPSKVATEVNPLAGHPHLSSGMGRGGLNVCMEPIGRERERNKLIILNVHGTLVDCSLE